MSFLNEMFDKKLETGQPEEFATNEQMGKFDEVMEGLDEKENPEAPEQNQAE